MKKQETKLNSNSLIPKIRIRWSFLIWMITFLSFSRLEAQDDCGNLLANPLGNSPVTTGWNILQVSGNSPGFGQLPGSGFLSTYGGCGTLRWNRKSQTVDLIAKGLNPAWLDSSPDIYVAETFTTVVTNAFCTYPSGNSLDLYYLKVELRDAGNNVLATINWGSTGAPLFAPTTGITHSHTFSGYPAGVRYIYFEDGGMDAGWWNGFYGTYMENATAMFSNPEDTDEDGTADCNDGCPNDAGKTAPGICGCGVADTDTDGDGTADCNDGCDNDPAKTEPGICGCGVADTDSDGDGTADCNDGCPNDVNKTAPGVCGCGTSDVDSDSDGTADCLDGCPADPNKIAAGQCGCGNPDTDTDGDGTADCNDGCPADPNKIAPGICGCGTSDVDSDSDGTADCNDGCPADPNKIAPGICGCGVADTDSDGDGTANCNDGCPNDPNKTAPGICGCGVADTDSDGDGTANCNDGCPTDPNKTSPGQCGCGNVETDSDCDGIADCNDICPGGDDTVDANNDNIPDCSQLLSYNSYSNAWKCGKDKIIVCHNGNNPHSLCINKNALSAHFNHGDKIGPCTTCGNAIKVKDQFEDVEGDHDHALEDLNYEVMKIVPNPASNYTEIWLEGINESGIITLMDLNGKSILQTRFIEGQNVIKLDLINGLSFGGTYFVRLESAERTITKRLIIVK